MTSQKRLIEEIRSIVLGVGMLDIASRDGVELIAAIVFDQKRKERQACATLARELTAAAGQRNAKALWRQEIGEEIALAITGRNDERDQSSDQQAKKHNDAIDALILAARNAKEHLIREFDEPGRSVFWELVDALKGMEGRGA